MNRSYEDILDKERPKSGRIPMSMEQRAAQFSPFDALEGYEESIQETGRQTKEPVELMESAREEMDRVMAALRECWPQMPQVKITYFLADEKKEGGAYLEILGKVKNPGEVLDRLYLTSGEIILIQDIVKMEILSE